MSVHLIRAHQTQAHIQRDVLRRLVEGEVQPEGHRVCLAIVKRRAVKHGQLAKAEPTVGRDRGERFAVERQYILDSRVEELAVAQV